MFKRLAFGLVIIIIVLGVLFMALDILDIAEGYSLHWSITVLNTIFIGSVAAFLACFSARDYYFTGSPEMLGLGCAACSFGLGILLYGWLNAGLSTRTVAYDIGFCLASVLILAGTCLRTARQAFAESNPRHRLKMILITYPGAIAVIGIVTWLASQWWPDYLAAAWWDVGVRDIIRWAASVLLAASAVIHIRSYLKSRSDVGYWYFLGLILLAGGIFFISRGQLESRIAWLGRVSQYAGCIYLLISSLGFCKYRPSGYTGSGKDKAIIQN
jgi:hypothetical protein